MKNLCAALALLLILALPAEAQSSLSLQVEPSVAFRAGDLDSEFYPKAISPALALGIKFESGPFLLKASGSANTDGKFAPILADTPSGTLGSLYAMMEEGGMMLKIGKSLVQAGRFRHYDEVDSPYSLAVNSRGASAFLARLRYEDSRFVYENRWISLTQDSAMATEGWPEAIFGGFPDRGANLKVYAAKFGEMRLGYQDIAVYSLRSFDAEYFLSPMPQYLTQYVRGQGGRPWSTGYDDNSLMGLFWDWNRPGSFYAYAQFLLDDFGAFGLGDWQNNPWQFAVSGGARFETGIGTVGLFLAGATRHTFEPRQVGDFDADTLAAIQGMSAYGYTYYPDTRFEGGLISIEDNNVGYLYGANNLALRVEWAGSAGDFRLKSGLEFRLQGMNSPANPWGDLTRDPQEGTRWLDDPVLEKRFGAMFCLSWERGNWVLGAALSGNIAFDALGLRSPILDPAEVATAAPADSGIWLYEPVGGLARWNLLFSAGAALRLGR
ncbi:MAG: hypothetical protein FD137_811 [Spirochaetes bacterium]|nr:MAG: hypothetical protein FD137_811 [Spirochaetota bacterium]